MAVVPATFWAMSWMTVKVVTTLKGPPSGGGSAWAAGLATLSVAAKRQTPSRLIQSRFNT